MAGEHSLFQDSPSRKKHARLATEAASPENKTTAAVISKNDIGSYSELIHESIEDLDELLAVETPEIILAKPNKRSIIKERPLWLKILFVITAVSGATFLYLIKTSPDGISESEANEALKATFGAEFTDFIKTIESEGNEKSNGTINLLP